MYKNDAILLQNAAAGPIIETVYKEPMMMIAEYPKINSSRAAKTAANLYQNSRKRQNRNKNCCLKTEYGKTNPIFDKPINSNRIQKQGETASKKHAIFTKQNQFIVERQRLNDFDKANLNQIKPNL
jgi:hypothetical protein